MKPMPTDELQEGSPWNAASYAAGFQRACSEYETGGAGKLCCFGDRAALEAACGHPIPDDVWRFVPWGRRVVVVREEPAKLYKGLIEIPTTVQTMMTQGWVVSAGHLVGTDPQPGAPGASPIPPEAIVGRKVLFGKYAGTPISPDDDPSSNVQTSSYVILRDEDLYGELMTEPAQPAAVSAKENAS